MKLGQLRDQISTMFTRLSRREQLLALGAAGGLLLLVSLVVVTSVQSAFATRHDRLEYKEQGLEQVIQLSSGFREAEADRRQMEAKLRQSKGVSLFTYMEELARGQGVTISNMTPRQPTTEAGITEQTVDVNLEGIPLDKLAGIINGVQRSPQIVKIKRLRVRRKFNDQERVDATMTVATYGLAG